MGIKKSSECLSKTKKSYEPIEALTHIITCCTTTSYLRHEIANTRFDKIMLPCLMSLKKGSAEEISLATKAIGFLAITTARGKNGDELLENTISFFSNIASEDVTVNVLECLAITTMTGATDYSGIERSMIIIWNFICSFSKSELKSKQNWASIMATAISAWSLLLTTINVGGWEVLKHYWNGVMTRIMDMLQEENCIQIACVEALAIICEKECFELFFDKEHHNNWNEQDWKDDILKQVTTACGWRSEFSKFFEVDALVKASKHIFYCNLPLESWTQLKRIEFIEEFFAEDFTVKMMENWFILHLFHLDSFGPKLYEPVYEEVGDKCSLRNVRSLHGSLRKMAVSSVRKERSIMRDQKRIAKAEILNDY